MIWPPRSSPGDQWQTVTLAGRGGTARVREVTLWGRKARIDEAGDVLCGCGQLVPITVLCTPGNKHIDSPVSGGGQLPMLTIREMAAASSESPSYTRAVFV